MKQIARGTRMASLVFALAGIAFAQQPNRDTKIPDFFNPRTRAFTAKSFPGIIPDLSTKTCTGTLKFDFTGKLDTPLPTGDDLVCSSTADAVDEGTGNFIEESAEKKSSVSG